MCLVTVAKIVATIRTRCKDIKLIKISNLYNYSRTVARLFQINKARCFFIFHESWCKLVK